MWDVVVQFPSILHRIQILFCQVPIANYDIEI